MNTNAGHLLRGKMPHLVLSVATHDPQTGVDLMNLVSVRYDKVPDRDHAPMLARKGLLEPHGNRLNRTYTLTPEGEAELQRLADKEKPVEPELEFCPVEEMAYNVLGRTPQMRDVLTKQLAKGRKEYGHPISKWGAGNLEAMLEAAAEYSDFIVYMCYLAWKNGTQFVASDFEDIDALELNLQQVEAQHAG